MAEEQQTDVLAQLADGPKRHSLNPLVSDFTGTSDAEIELALSQARSKGLVESYTQEGVQYWQLKPKEETAAQPEGETPSGSLNS